MVGKPSDPRNTVREEKEGTVTRTMTTILRSTLFATAILAGTGVARAQGTVQPITQAPGGVNAINDLVRRVTDGLGSSTLDTKKIADNLEKGFPFTPPVTPPGSDSLGDQAKKKGDPNIQLAGGAKDDEPKAPAANGNGNANANGNGNGNGDGFKSTLDAIDGLFKMQADAIRSIDLKSGRMVPPGESGPSIGASGGRVGFMLANLPPEVGAQLKLPPGIGLIVKEVFPKTPAEGAGYKKNDVLISFGGRDVPATVNDFMDRNFRFVKNDTPIAGTVIREGEKVTLGELKITDRRVVPALPNERAPDYTQLIQIAPGINSVMPNTIRVPEVRSVPRGGGIRDIILVDPNSPPKK